MSGATPEWADVVAWAEAELEKAFAQLEVPGTDFTATEVLRARIQAMRDLIEFPNKQPAPEVPAVPTY